MKSRLPTVLEGPRREIVVTMTIKIEYKTIYIYVQFNLVLFFSILFSQMLTRRLMSTAAGATRRAAAPFTVFQSTGMLMARPVPLQYIAVEESGEGAPQVAREGYVSVVVIPRDESSNTFNKEKKISLKLRSKQIGQLIAWKGYKTPFTVNGVYGSSPSVSNTQLTIELKPTEDQTIQLSVVPKATTGDLEIVSIPISLGELKTLQILLESVVPTLYGWVEPTTSPKQRASNYGDTFTEKPKSPEDFFKQFSGQQ